MKSFVEFALQEEHRRDVRKKLKSHSFTKKGQQGKGYHEASKNKTQILSRKSYYE